MSTSLSGDSSPCPRAHGFDKHPGRLWTVLGAAVSNSCPRELALGPRSPSVDQLSVAIRACVRVTEVSTSSPGRLVLTFQGPRGRPDVFGDSGPVPRARGFEQVSKETRARDRGPAGQPDVPGDSGPAPWACRVDQLSQATRTLVRGPAGTTISPGCVALSSNCPRG